MTVLTFPGNQAGVEFINCLAASRGRGFHDARYSESGYANHCVSADGTAAAWDSGDGSEANTFTNAAVSFVNAAGGDHHLAPADTGDRKRGAPGLGADIDGEGRCLSSHQSIIGLFR